MDKLDSVASSGEVRWTLPGVILLRKLCGMASLGGCRFAARQCSTTVTFEVGLGTQDLIHTHRRPFKSQLEGYGRDGLRVEIDQIPVWIDCFRSRATIFFSFGALFELETRFM